MEQMILAYGLPKETVTVIMILFKNMKAMVCSSDGNRLLQHCLCNLKRQYISTIFVYTLPRLCTLNIHKSKKRDGFTLKKKKQTVFLKNYDRYRLHR